MPSCDSTGLIAIVDSPCRFSGSITTGHCQMRFCVSYSARMSRTRASASRSTSSPSRDVVVGSTRKSSIDPFAPAQKTTRLTSRSELVMAGDSSAIAASSYSPVRRAVCAYVRSSPWTPTPRTGSTRAFRLKLDATSLSCAFSDHCGRLVCAEEAHREARARKRLLLDEAHRQPERATDLADLVLVELHERLDNLAGLYTPQQFGHAVVMRLDERRFTRAARLDGVGINRALAEQPLAGWQVLEHVVLDRKKSDADSLTLDLGVRLAADGAQEFRRGIAQAHVLESGFVVRRHHLDGFVLPHEPGVDIHAVNAILAECVCAQFVCDGRIDAAAHEKQHVLRRADARANVRLDGFDGFRRGRAPVRSAPADAADEILEDALAEFAMRDLGMELHTVDVPGGIHHRRDRTVIGGAQHLEAIRQLLHRVAVAHPHLAVVRNAIEQRIFAC